MTRKAGAQAGESKLESRFAALTSGLLARKGFAAPSNSPIADPAEETDAYSLEPKSKAAKPAPATGKNAPKEVAAKEAPAKVAQKPAQKRAEPEIAAATRIPDPPAKPKSETKPPAPKPAQVSQITIINERSYEAGYPDNPTPEEIAALEAEADEVVSYFENFGSEEAISIEKDDFYGDDDQSADVLDELDDLDEGSTAPDNTVTGPWSQTSVPQVAASAGVEVRAGVTVQLTAREFMRLSLGAAELGESAQDLIVEAIEEYLDARGVLSLGGCSCLDVLTKKPGGQG